MRATFMVQHGVTGHPTDDVYPLGFRDMNGGCTAVTSLPAPKEDWPPRDAPRVRFELVPRPNQDCEPDSLTSKLRSTRAVSATICNGTSKRRCLPTTISLYERLLHGRYNDGTNITGFCPS
jgi:hypothetical protein